MSDDMDVVKQGRGDATGLNRKAQNKPPAFDDSRRSSLSKIIALVLVFLIGFGLVVYFLVVRKEHGAKTGDRVAPVTVATAQRQAVPIEIRTTGNVQAYSVVNVLPQVSGQLMKVHFTQGDFVKKGQLLFQIDPRPFKAAYDQAMGNVAKDTAQIHAAQAALEKDQAQLGNYKANLSKDEAQLKFSRVEKKRYEQLVKDGAVSNEQADQMATNELSAVATESADKETIRNGEAVVEGDKANIATAKGTLEVDQAAARSSQISLGWCDIRSPMDGRTSTLNIYEGNVVTANSTQTALVTIAQIQPIYISFSVPEDYLSAVRRCMDARTLRVKAMIEGLRTDTVLGNASFLEYTVNTTSGTALLRATFPNTDMRLYPGQFVDVIVTMPPAGDSIVVPANAVQTTQQGNSVYVVQSDNTVNLVRVDLKRTYGDWAAIGSGISAGDIVVTDGQLALTPGAKVKVVQSQEKPRHRAGTASGSVSAGTPMNTTGDQTSDSGGPQFSGNQDSNSGAPSNLSNFTPVRPAQDETTTNPIPGNYGSSNTPSPIQPGLDGGGHGHHRHGLGFSAVHGGAPLNNSPAQSTEPSTQRGNTDSGN